MILLTMIMLMFWEIEKIRLRFEPVIIIAKAQFSQPKIIHSSGVYIFGMSIVGIRHVDSWSVASPISFYEIRISEHWSNIGFYVI